MRRFNRVGKWSAVALAVLCVALWLIAGWRELRVSGGTRSFTTWLGAHSGRLELGHVQHPNSSPPWQTHFDVTPLRPMLQPGPSWRWWFHRTTWAAASGFTGTSVLIPFWAPFTLAVGVGAFFWIREWPRRGQCRSCGYDLTGNTSGVCPECGRVHPASIPVQQSPLESV